MKLTQHSWLVSLLGQHPHGCTLVEINDYWQQSSAYNGRPISRTSLFRARDTILNQFGILIECECHKGNSRYKIGNPSELQSDSMKNWLYSNLTVGNLLADHTALKDRIMLENTPVDTAHLRDILSAMKERVVLTIVYRKYSGESSERAVAPLALKLWQQRWYLLGCEPRCCKGEGFVEGLRVFSLNRIRQVSVGGEKFRMRRDFSPQTYFSECFGVYPGVDCEAERIVLRAYGQTPHYLRDLPLHHSQRELETVGDHTDFELFLRATPDFLNHLLVHGAGLQIVSPSSVADKMREIICGLARRYDFPYSVSHDHKTT